MNIVKADATGSRGKIAKQAADLYALVIKSLENGQAEVLKNTQTVGVAFDIDPKDINNKAKPAKLTVLIWPCPYFVRKLHDPVVKAGHDDPVSYSGIDSKGNQVAYVSIPFDVFGGFRTTFLMTPGADFMSMMKDMTMLKRVAETCKTPEIKSVMIHEITHALDYIRSGFKTRATYSPRNIDRSSVKSKGVPSEYYTDPLENHANAQQVLAMYNGVLTGSKGLNQIEDLKKLVGNYSSFYSVLTAPLRKLVAEHPNLKSELTLAKRTPIVGDLKAKRLAKAIYKMYLVFKKHVNANLASIHENAQVFAIPELTGDALAKSFEDLANPDVAYKEKEEGSSFKDFTVRKAKVNLPTKILGWIKRGIQKVKNMIKKLTHVAGSDVSQYGFEVIARAPALDGFNLALDDVMKHDLMEIIAHAKRVSHDQLKTMGRFHLVENPHGTNGWIVESDGRFVSSNNDVEAELQIRVNIKPKDASHSPHFNAHGFEVGVEYECEINVDVDYEMPEDSDAYGGEERFYDYTTIHFVFKDGLAKDLVEAKFGETLVRIAKSVCSNIADRLDEE